MYGCDLLFTPNEAATVKATVRANLGGECPCDRGERCPILPDDLSSVLLPTPVMRRSA